MSSLVEVASGRELIADGGVGNELAVYDEYPAHPEAGEGPWHLLPKGPVVASSAGAAASVQAYRGPLGERLVIRGRIGDVLRYTQIVTLSHGRRASRDPAARFRAVHAVCPAPFAR